MTRSKLASLSLAALALATEVAAAPSGPRNDDGQPDIVFDVERKGDVIGTHRISFRDQSPGNAGTLVVDARFDIAIPFLFFEGYTYTYESRAEWVHDNLEKLDARIDDDGDTWRVSAERQGDDVVVAGPDGVTVTPAPIFPTNHWNPGVLDAKRVLNTITGTIDRVAIEPVGQETVDTEAGPVSAIRYRYTGDLVTEVLYDHHGRWVGMTFEGEDGSEITYRCRRCQGGTNRAATQ